MTIIVAAVSPDFAMIASDSMRSANDGTNLSVEKIRQLSTKVIVAKGGFGTLTDPAWDQLEALSDKFKDDVRLLAKEAWKLGGPIYQNAKDISSKLGGEDLGLFLIIAGIDRNDTTFLAALNFGLNEYKEYDGVDGITVIGLGSISQAQTIALDTATRIVHNAGILIPEAWAKEVVQQGENIDPKTIGFPVHGKVLRRSGTREFTVTKPKSPAKP